MTMLLLRFWTALVIAMPRSYSADWNSAIVYCRQAGARVAALVFAGPRADPGILEPPDQAHEGVGVARDRVGVHHDHDVGRDVLEAEVERPGLAAVALVDGRDHPGMGGDELAHDLPGLVVGIVVGRAVVDQDDMDGVGETLRTVQNPLDRVPDDLGLFPARDQDPESIRMPVRRPAVGQPSVEARAEQDQHADHDDDDGQVADQHRVERLQDLGVGLQPVTGRVDLGGVDPQGDDRPGPTRLLGEQLRDGHELVAVALPLPDDLRRQDHGGGPAAATVVHDDDQPGGARAARQRGRRDLRALQRVVGGVAGETNLGEAELLAHQGVEHAVAGRHQVTALIRRTPDPGLVVSHLGHDACGLDQLVPGRGVGQRNELGVGERVVADRVAVRQHGPEGLLVGEVLVADVEERGVDVVSIEDAEQLRRPGLFRPVVVGEDEGVRRHGTELLDRVAAAGRVGLELGERPVDLAGVGVDGVVRAAVMDDLVDALEHAGADDRHLQGAVVPVLAVGLRAFEHGVGDLARIVHRGVVAGRGDRQLGRRDPRPVNRDRHEAGHQHQDREQRPAAPCSWAVEDLGGIDLADLVGMQVIGSRRALGHLGLFSFFLIPRRAWRAAFTGSWRVAVRTRPVRRWSE
jgi:hypothetical protein